MKLFTTLLSPSFYFKKRGPVPAAGALFAGALCVGVVSVSVAAWKGVPVHQLGSLLSSRDGIESIFSGKLLNNAESVDSESSRQTFTLSEEVALANPNQPYPEYLLFTREVFMHIEEHFWQKVLEHQLVELYVRAIDQLSGQPKTLQKDEQNWAGLEDLIASILIQIETDDIRLEFITQMNDLVLANLEPFGRSRLFNQQKQQELADKVDNKVDTDFYEVLELDEQASEEDIRDAAAQKQAQLEQIAQEDPSRELEVSDQLELTERAADVLTRPDARERFDTQRVAPTMTGKVLSPHIFYIHITQFSPNTPQELAHVAELGEDTPTLDTLILDLRGNIGGAIDGLPYFLGPFIGPDRYAYQFFSRDRKIDFKTKTGWMNSLVPYKKVVILIDDKVQSTGEVMAASLKKYNVGVLVGVPTKGWGSVERVFEIQNQIADDDVFSMFLVHSLTLRDDGQPIEGLGVDPMVNIMERGWQQLLYTYIPDQSIVDTVAELVTIR